MTQHIGIVACSAEGAALCYRTICAEAAQFMGEHAHPEITLHSASLAKYVHCLEHDDLAGVADLMLASAEVLAKAGADFFICPDNTIHQAFDLLCPRSPLPYLHIAEVVAQQAAHLGFKKLGLLGTKWLIDSDVYPSQLSALGLSFVRPSDPERNEISRIIMDELVKGVIRVESVNYFLQVIENFKQQGCDAVVLGCTEIPLIVNEVNSCLPILDSTRLLARAALQRACQA
jgi:aspartate racemase